MEKVSKDGLRVFRVEARGGEFLVSVGNKAEQALTVASGEIIPAGAVYAEHTFGTYEREQDAMRVFRELSERRECLGVTNWETSSMALRIEQDRDTYAARLELYRKVTAEDARLKAERGPQWGRKVSARDMRGFATRHGFTVGVPWSDLEVVDWHELAGWFEVDRQDYARHGDL